MSKNETTICLNMIVKDESKIILRCLESVKEIIDHWVICDTGSTDGTQKIIIDFFEKQGIPGELIEAPWVNFAHNRNIALNHADGKADYLLIMDADDYIKADATFRFENLTADSYLLKNKRGSIEYFFTKLVRTDLPWKWKGVLHEYLECECETASEKYLGHYMIHSTTDGARSQNPEKYKNDIKVLEEALEKEPENSRYQFYLAQSYRDDGNFEKAVEHYQKRADMGGWNEEVYMSLYEVGANQLKLGMDASKVLESFLTAYYCRTTRLEALYEAVKMCRVARQYHLGYHIGKAAVNTPIPKDTLFVSKYIYEWGLKDEVSICASWINHKVISRELITEILQVDSIPPAQRDRIKSNLAYC